MEGRDAMDAQMELLEREAFAPPVINPWRQAPTPAQVEYATDLCRSELTLPERTIDRFPTMSRAEMSALIRSLKAQRLERLKRAPRNCRWRLVL